MSETHPCDSCGETVESALSRTVRLSVDRSQIDSQRLCPECFAEWINRYQREMQAHPQTVEDVDDEIIVD